MAASTITTCDYRHVVRFVRLPLRGDASSRWSLCYSYMQVMSMTPNWFSLDPCVSLSPLQDRSSI
ncbi:hypothetical protein DAI22_06g246500 [Oryza sativa Japonica Group]|nr:hypothetical protein DAI22_06g246500 [Oryza sativa Japonica Group]